MKHLKRTALVLFSLCALIVATAFISLHKPIVGKSGAGKEQGAPQAVNQKIVENYGKFPLSFEANQGQADSQVKFISRGSGYSLFLTSTEAVLSLQEPPASKGPLPSAPSSKSAAFVVKMRLVGANPSPQLTGRDELPGKSNYFIGNDPAKWRTNVPNYAKVKYADVYPGIDLVYYGNQRQLEYDFVVAPGADPRAIRFAIDGHKERRIDAKGDLVLEVEGSELRLHRPVIYQEINGSRRSFAGNFVIHDIRQVGFEVAQYDASKPLIIDPVLSYSTYLGGSSADSGSGIAVDSAGNAYVTGYTDSSDFPTTNVLKASKGGSTLVFVTKLNAAGSAVGYSTYFGGSGNDFGRGIAVDSSGNAYITGYTGSADFPTANAFQATKTVFGDAFVTKLNVTGSALVYSTYLGGSNGASGNGIAVDSSGNAYVTGTTASSDFPTANAFQPAFAGGFADAFVTKFNAAGSALVYSTYLGGRGSGDYGDTGNAIAVDSSGNAYVTGYTDSPDFPTANPFQAVTHCCNGYEYMGDAFVTKFNAAGSALIYSSHLGGSAWDVGNAIAVDPSGNAYVTGTTYSSDFPTANAIQPARPGSQNGFVTSFFVTKINAAGSAVVYSTYLDGGSFETGSTTGIAADSSGNAYVTGFTSSVDFPANAFQTDIRGYHNAFVTKFNAAGSALVYSSFLGGSGEDFGAGIAVDPLGNAYVTGSTCSADFPIANAFQAAYAGPDGCPYLGDAFVTKIPAVSAAPDPWQPAIAAMKTAAGTDSLNFWEWAWQWQYLPAFQGAPAGFGVVGSISPGVMGEIIVAGGGDGFRVVSAEQWALYYRQALTTDSLQQAASAMETATGTDSLNFWQWAWYWQRSPAFAGAPTGFGVLGSIDNTPGTIYKIIVDGGGDGFALVSAEQWALFYRISSMGVDCFRQSSRGWQSPDRWGTENRPSLRFHNSVQRGDLRSSFRHIYGDGQHDYSPKSPHGDFAA